MTSEDLNQVDSLPLKLAISAAVSRYHLKLFQQMPNVQRNNSQPRMTTEMKCNDSNFNVRRVDDLGSKIDMLYDINNNNKRKLTGRQPEQNRFTTSLLPPEFCEKFSKSQSTVSGIPNRCRVTMGTAYRDLLFNDVRRTQHLFSGLLQGTNLIREPNMKSTKFISSRDNGRESPKQANFMAKEESLVGTPHFPESRLTYGRDTFYNSHNKENAYCRESTPRNYDSEVNDEFTSASRPQSSTTKNSVFTFGNNPHGSIENQHVYSSNKFFRSFDAEKENRINDTTSEFEFEAGNYGSIRNDDRDNFLNSLSPSEGCPSTRHYYNSEFNDDFLSPFEFTAESRRNRAAEEFTTPNSNSVTQISSFRTPDFTAGSHDRETNGEFSNFFEFDDHNGRETSTDAFNNDLFTSSNFSRHIDTNEDPHRNFHSKSDLDYFDTKFKEERQSNSVPVFDPVQNQSRDDSNSFNFQFPTPPLHSGDNFLDDEQLWNNESPSVIEATPDQNESPFVDEKHHQKNYISRAHPRKKIDEILESGSEMYFQDLRKHKSTNYEDIDNSTEVSTPISTKKAKELLPFISYVHNGRLIVEENNDYS